MHILSKINCLECKKDFETYNQNASICGVCSNPFKNQEAKEIDAPIGIIFKGSDWPSKNIKSINKLLKDL